MYSLGFLGLVGCAPCVAGPGDNQAWFLSCCVFDTPGLRCFPWFGVLGAAPVVSRMESAAVGAGCCCGAILGAVVCEMEFSTFDASCVSVAVAGGMSESVATEALAHLPFSVLGFHLDDQVHQSTEFKNLGPVACFS